MFFFLSCCALLFSFSLNTPQVSLSRNKWANHSSFYFSRALFFLPYFKSHCKWTKMRETRRRKIKITYLIFRHLLRTITTFCWYFHDPFDKSSFTSIEKENRTENWLWIKSMNFAIYLFFFCSTSSFRSITLVQKSRSSYVLDMEAF